MKCIEIIKHIEKFAPLNLAENWDNVGLQVGDSEQDVRRVLVSLDLNSDVVSEAVENKVDLIVTHHPLLYKPLQAVIRQDNRGRLVYSLIENNISYYCAHTNFDFATGGTNDILAHKVGLKDSQIIMEYHKEGLRKIVVFVPEGEYVEKVREAMCTAGAGWIGKYSNCTYMGKGIGTFKPLEGTTPFIGEQGVLEETGEVRLETVVPESKVNVVISAMLGVHPYEEVAYDVYSIENGGNVYGNGRIGQLEDVQDLNGFIDMLKANIGFDDIRLIGSTSTVKNVAVAAGSYDRGLLGYITGRADVIVCGDVKYHDAREIVDMGMCAIDIGHYASENIVVDAITQYISGLAVDVMASKVNLNPFKNV